MWTLWYTLLLVDKRRPDVAILAEHKFNPFHKFTLAGYKIYSLISKIFL